MSTSAIPPRFARNFMEEHPGYKPGTNEETDALFNPSIEARPLHIPMAGQIKTRLASDLEFYWAFDRLGQNPYHDRVDQLRAVGFEYATTKDVVMAVEATIKNANKDGFSNEIRNGDRRLMKVKKRRWLEIRKDSQLRAIFMMNPKGKMMGEDGTVMGVATSLPGTQTRLADEATLAELSGKAAVSDAKSDIQDGVVRGNKSVVPQTKVHQGQ